MPFVREPCADAVSGAIRSQSAPVNSRSASLSLSVGSASIKSFLVDICTSTRKDYNVLAMFNNQY